MKIHPLLFSFILWGCSVSTNPETKIRIQSELDSLQTQDSISLSVFESAAASFGDSVSLDLSRRILDWKIARNLIFADREKLLEEQKVWLTGSLPSNTSDSKALEEWRKRKERVLALFSEEAALAPELDSIRAALNSAKNPSKLP